MKKWPLPNLVDGELDPIKDFSFKYWYTSDEEYELRNYTHLIKNFPKGWSNPWPDLPIPDEIHDNISLDKIDLEVKKYRCTNDGLLGYYLSWHIVGKSFQNSKGRLPSNGYELSVYNSSLPEENRFGIHICCKNIENYINLFSTRGLDPAEVPSYLEYCTFLALIYVIAHEWGHYRSEVLSFQLNNLVRSVSGGMNSGFRPSYLSYFVHKKRFPLTNFEEVFAEWAAMKLGIFNYFIKKPVFAQKISNWPDVESTVKFMLTEAISRPSRIRPYSDIRFWIDIEKISRSAIMKRISQNQTSINRSVNDNVRISGIKSLKKGKMIDFLMHNQMQFSLNHQFNGIIKSAPRNYPFDPDSLFYHFGEDECMIANDPSDSNKFLKLNDPQYSNKTDRDNSRISKVIDSLKEPDASNALLPIKLFPEILPLDPVYFHI